MLRVCVCVYRSDFMKFIQELRSSSGGTLNSMNLQDMVAEVTQLILDHQVKQPTDQTTFLLRSLSSLMFHFDNPLICHRIHSFMSQLLLSGEAEICQTECSGASSFGCQPPSGSPGLADPGAPESCTLRRSKSKVIHHV